MKRNLEELDKFSYRGAYAKKVKSESENYGHFDFEYYRRWLSTLTNPTAIYLRDNVLDKDASNAFGMSFDKINSKSFLAWTLKEKAKYPRCILAIQVGEFFELCGIDAILTVEFGGLRAMGKTPTMKSGTPLASLQRLLDSLVENGLTIRVYEEFGTSIKQQFKKRNMCQVVSKSNPVYFRALNTVEEDDSRECRPLVYVLIDQVLTVDMISHTYTRYFGLSRRANKALISSVRPAEISCVAAFRDTVDSVYPLTIIPPTETVTSILSNLRKTYELDDEFVESKWDHNRIPLMKSTSDQLGIASSVDCIPDVISSALGRCSYIERIFFTNWVLVKPTKLGRAAMQRICLGIANGDIAIKNIRPLNPNKIYGLLSSGGICKDRSLLAKVYSRLINKVVCEDLHTVAKEYMGISQEYDIYQKHLKEIIALLDSHVLVNIEKPDTSKIPTDFMLRNEAHIVNVPSIKEMLNARTELHNYLQTSNFHDISYYPFDNDIAVNQKTKPVGKNIMQATNHKGIRKNAWTTTELSTLVEKYLTSCEKCLKDQLELVRSISLKLTGEYGKSMRLFLQCEVIAKCIHTHLAQVISKGWHAAEVKGDARELFVQDGFPHWLSNSSATLNSLKMVEGELVLLTAPNATGKTTLIRSLMISAVLAHAGVYVPAKCAIFPDVNHFFLRLPGSDRPAEGLSSFESEVQDLQLMLDVVDKDTIICLDELARSTCPREGIAIAQAVIEYLLTKSCYCIFSTHLHDLLDKNLTVTRMTMADNHSYIKGNCRTSRALEVCRKHKVSQCIVDRAAFLLGVSQTEVQKPVQSTCETLEKIASCITGSTCVHVQLGTLIPPNLTSSPCVYIIQESENLWYCGESKHVINRQEQHELHNNRFGNIMVFPVANKSVALQCETLIQRKCIEKGINLSSVKDSFHSV